MTFFSPRLDFPGDADLLVAGKQIDGAHLAQILAHGSPTISLRSLHALAAFFCGRLDDLDLVLLQIEFDELEVLLENILGAEDVMDERVVDDAEILLRSFDDGLQFLAKLLRKQAVFPLSLQIRRGFASHDLDVQGRETGDDLLLVVEKVVFLEEADEIVVRDPAVAGFGHFHQHLDETAEIGPAGFRGPDASAARAS